MSTKDFVIKLAQQFKPEAVISYEFITIGGVNVYTLTWCWEYKGIQLKHKLFFSGNESEPILTIRINSEVANMDDIEGVVLRAELLKQKK